MRFAAPNPITSASVVTISKYRIALPPIRPIVLMLPVPAIPTTNVANIRGAMMDLIKRRKTVPSRPNSFAGPGNAAPNAMPANSAIRIQTVSDGLFTDGLSPFAPFQFFTQHIEEHHVRRTHQADAMLRSAADNPVAGFEDLADLPIDRHVSRRIVEYDHLNLTLVGHDDRTVGECVRTNWSNRGGGHRGKHDGPARRKRV